MATGVNKHPYKYGYYLLTIKSILIEYFGSIRAEVQQALQPFKLEQIKANYLRQH